MQIPAPISIRVSVPFCTPGGVHPAQSPVSAAETDKRITNHILIHIPAYCCCKTSELVDIFL